MLSVYELGLLLFRQTKIKENSTDYIGIRTATTPNPQFVNSLKQGLSLRFKGNLIRQKERAKNKIKSKTG